MSEHAGSNTAGSQVPKGSCELPQRMTGRRADKSMLGASEVQAGREGIEWCWEGYLQPAGESESDAVGEAGPKQR